VATTLEGAPPEAANELTPPGTLPRRRFRLKLHYELIGCGMHGHKLVGRDVAEVSDADEVIVREWDGLRWHRCLRCDSWLALRPPTAAGRQKMPTREEIKLPLRGRPLRDRIVLRVIAVDRVIHFLALGALASAILLFAQDRNQLKGEYTRVINAIQGAAGGPLFDTNHNSLLHDINTLFSLSTTKLYLLGVGIGIYAAINGIEAVGLWRARRWAEYLTLFELTVLLPIEIYELTIRVTTLKSLTLVLNVAIVVYLLVAHRLLGIRGGGAVDQAERDRDSGWPPIERATPRYWAGRAATEPLATLAEPLPAPAIGGSPPAATLAEPPPGVPLTPLNP